MLREQRSLQEAGAGSIDSEGSSSAVHGWQT
jgi:hypothetical protein